MADLPNTILLAHIGSATVAVRHEMLLLSALNTIAMAEGRLPPHAVNPEVMSCSLTHDPAPGVSRTPAHEPRPHLDNGPVLVRTLLCVEPTTGCTGPRP